MKIIYLYSEIVGYQIEIFRKLVEEYKCEVIVFHWDENKIKPYSVPQIPGVIFHSRSNYSSKQILKICKQLQPSLVYISGWMDKAYLLSAWYLRSKKIPIVVGFDDNWEGNIRQQLGSFFAKLLFSFLFSHAWVAGPYQYEYARKMGFNKSNIIFDLLSSNTVKFNPNKFIKNKFPNAFLYVGNFRSIKGFDLLIEAYKIYCAKYNGKWDLICVGNGNLKENYTTIEKIIFYDFCNEDELINLSEKASIFVLPSRKDQWGVVVHEFTALGMPLLLSENVGSRAIFFIKGYNGLMFQNNSVHDLAYKMHLFSNKSKFEISKMSENSQALASRINIETSVANLISIIK